MQKHVSDARRKAVFKIVDADAWRRAVDSGTYSGSEDDKRDGFIHLSDGSQVEETYRKYFQKRRDLLLVAFNSAALGAKLKWEASRGGAMFPHYYGDLPAALALWERHIDESASGAVQAFEDLL